MSEEKQGSGVGGVLAGAGAAVGSAVLVDKKFVRPSVMEAALDGTAKQFTEGKGKDFATKVAEVAGKTNVGETGKTVKAALSETASVLKPAEGAAKATAEAIKDATALKKDALAGLSKALKAEKIGVFKHAGIGKQAAVVGAGIIAAVGTKAIADRVFGKHTAKVEADRTAPAQAAGRA